MNEQTRKHKKLRGAFEEQKKKKLTMRTELKRFFHKEVKAQEKMQDLRLLRFSAT